MCHDLEAALPADLESSVHLVVVMDCRRVIRRTERYEMALLLNRSSNLVARAPHAHTWRVWLSMRARSRCRDKAARDDRAGEAGCSEVTSEGCWNDDGRTAC